MATTLTKTVTTCVIEDADCRGGLAIYLSQQLDTDRTRWEFEVWANSGDGLIWVGKFTTCPAQNNSQKTRLVATAAVPGAFSFQVIVRPAARYGSELQAYSGEVMLSAGDPGGQLPGVQRVSERAKYYANNVAGLLNIPAGERVVAWSAFSTGPVASVVINGGDSIPIPDSASVAGGDDGLFEGPLQFAFNGADFGGYLVEVAESA
jgi:hypothetical protein